MSFADKKFIESQNYLKKTARQNGIDKVISWTFEDVRNTDFYVKNRDILDLPRGCGYWLWKPYIILQTLKEIKEDDILLYCDAGTEIIDNVLPLVDLCRTYGRIIFENATPHTNIKWTKREVFQYFNMDSEEYWNKTQVTASFMLFAKRDDSINLLTEWLDICCIKSLLVDEKYDALKEHDQFIEHRHDQSILSLLIIKHNIEVFRDPSQFGNSEKMKKYRKWGEFLWCNYYEKDAVKKNSPYGQIFYQNRGNLNDKYDESLRRRIYNLRKRIKRR